ncbi:MAG: hypothetical protein ACYDGM_14725 [Vulcanimicrobiaceae bacterium]
MKRPFFFSVVTSFVLLCAVAVAGRGSNPSIRAEAAVRPTPTPTPVAIAYDEINRMAFGQTTPPPVGAFSEDYHRIMESLQTPVTQPPRPHGMAGLLGHMMKLPSSAQMSNPMLTMENGSLKRYTYYWVRGWIRIDDPATHTAIIEKCREHQRIILDLEHKTYKIETYTNETGDRNDVQAPAPSVPGSPYSQTMSAAGTATMTVRSTGTALGPKMVEGIHTQGYDMTNALSIAKATGSCHNGSFSSRIVEYISGINKPRAYCPLAGRTASNGNTYGAMGGCRPTIAAHEQGRVSPPPGKLAMYRLSTFGTATAPMGAAAMVLERGNVTWLYNPDIPALFTIPAGFTQTS